MARQLLLAYDFPPMGGGIARWMGEMARRYPPGSLAVSTGQHRNTVAMDAGFPNRIDRAAVSSRRLRTVQGILLWSRRVAMLARAVEAEFIWCGNLKPAAYPAKWTKGRVGTPYGVLVHGGDLLILQRQVRRSFLKQRVARALLRSASVVVANSEWTADLCRSLLHQLDIDASPQLVRTVPLGSDPVIFRPRLPQDEVRGRYGLDGRRWLLSVARLAPHKGIDSGIRVLSLLRNDYPDLGYAVVGAGAQLPALEALAASSGVADRVRFLTGVPDSDLPAVYNCAEIYLGLSRLTALAAEGFGISLAEASASGLPVVAGRSGGIPEAVRHGETGLLVDAEQPEEVSRALRSLLDDRTLALRLGAAGRRAVKSYYNWDRVAADLADIGHELGVPGPREVAHQ